MNAVHSNRRPKLYPKTALQRLSVFVGTFCGAGLLPKAPGTWGTFASLPLFWWIAGESIFLKIAVLVFLLVVGTFASAEIQKMSGCGDHQSIVIDEALGTGITLLFTQADWKWFLIGAIVFRFFDIVKIAPVNWVDQWSKSRGNNPIVGGFGVMADDLIAGVQAIILLEAIKHFVTLP